LGENLTIEGLHHRELRVGDQLRAGSSLLQITKPRQPCRTLDPYGPGIQTWLWDATVKKGNTESPRWGRSGFYVKVLEPGDVQPGDTVSVVSAV
jgi:MOSC domain-containing protein YiiM